MKQKVTINSYLCRLYCTVANRQPHDYIGNATRVCVGKDSWGTPNVSQCRSMVLIKILTEDLEPIVAAERLPRVFRQLVPITEAVRTTINTTNPILPNDIPIIMNILETILK